MTLGRPRGFTSVELLIIFGAIVGSIMILIVIGLTFPGNAWFYEEDVLKTLQAHHPNVARLLIVDRNAFARSFITVENLDGTRNVYLLDVELRLWCELIYHLELSTEAAAQESRWYW